MNAEVLLIIFYIYILFTNLGVITINLKLAQLSLHNVNKVPYN